MIDAKDLMIGNLITGGTVVELADNGEIKVWDGIANFSSKSMSEQWKQEQPIPLTPDILVRLGLEVIDDNPKNKPHYEGDITFRILDFTFTNSMIDGFISYGLNDGIVVYKYVHELQNLVRLLTGTELTFNQQ